MPRKREPQRLVESGPEGSPVDPTASSKLIQRQAVVEGMTVHYRESANPDAGPVMVHIAGFGLSGRSLTPTAELLADEFHTYVPDLPGFGRSSRPKPALDVEGLADAIAAFLDQQGIESATLVGNSMGCAVICAFAHAHPDRIDRAVLVSPAGGLHNQPLHKAIRQMAHDGIREPFRLLPVVVPDYLRFGIPSTFKLFRTLTQFPALARLLELKVPVLGVVGGRDPLVPGPERLREVANMEVENHVVLVAIEEAAHAINFTHPAELSNVIRQFMADQPIVDDPDAPGTATAYEFYRGIRLRSTSPDSPDSPSSPDSPGSPSSPDSPTSPDSPSSPSSPKSAT